MPYFYEIKQRPSFAKLTEGELSRCLQKAFNDLPEEDQANIKRALEPLMAIRNIGLASALRVLFVLEEAEALDRLDAAVLNSSVPQETAPVLFSDHRRSGGNGADAADRAHRN